MKIKKVWTLIAVGVFAMVMIGCTSHKQDVQIENMTSLAEILIETNNLTQQFQRGEITMEEFNRLSLELQDKYDQLTQNNTETGEEWESLQKDLDEQFESIQTAIEEAKEVCTIPERAEELGITKPEGLAMEKDTCAQTSASSEGFDSVMLTYKGKYEDALQQAKIIADKANIPVSAEFKMAQEVLSGLTTEEIDKITEGGMLRGIVYSNVGLLATNMEYLITISVDEDGKLVIEVVNYEQMKK